MRNYSKRIHVLIFQNILLIRISTTAHLPLALASALASALARASALAAFLASAFAVLATSAHAALNRSVNFNKFDGFVSFQILSDSFGMSLECPKFVVLYVEAAPIFRFSRIFRGRFRGLAIGRRGRANHHADAAYERPTHSTPSRASRRQAPGFTFTAGAASQAHIMCRSRHAQFPRRSTRSAPLPPGDSCIS